MSKIVSYRDLRVWHDAMDLAELIHHLATRVAAPETYALTDQMKRASVSVPSNIAEGFGRGHRAAYVNHLMIAKGSLFEVDTQVRLAVRFGLVSPGDAHEPLALIERTGRRLTRLVAALRRGAPHHRRKAQGPGPKAGREYRPPRSRHPPPPAPPSPAAAHSPD